MDAKRNPLSIQANNAQPWSEAEVNAEIARGARRNKLLKTLIPAIIGGGAVILLGRALGWF